MDYLYHYHNLIKKAKERHSILYTEKHHIIPKSIFNMEIANSILDLYDILDIDSKENIVELLPEEHFIAHLLLLKIFSFDSNCHEKMLYAANFMMNRTKNNKDYKWLKISFSEMMRNTLSGKKSRAFGKKWSSESRIKITGVNNKNFGKKYEDIYGLEKAKELKNNRKICRLGKINSEETRKKLSERKITDDWKNKISKSNTGKKRNYETKKKISDFMSNSNTNPNINQTLYKFYNIDGREIIARKYDMKKIYGCNLIHKLVKGLIKYNMGWYYKNEIIGEKNGF